MRASIGRALAGAVLFPLLMTAVCCAQQAERYRPRAPIYVPDVKEYPDDTEEVSGSSEELVEGLTGLVLLDSPDRVSEEKVEASGLKINAGNRLDLLRSPQFQMVVAPYFGKPVSLRSINQMGRDIVAFYRRNNRPVVDVAVPEQDVTNGVVQLVVTEARVGQVRVSGPCYFDPSVLAQQPCTTPHDAHIYESVLMEDLRWLNRSRYRDVELRLKPGENRGETDIFFDVKDQLPLTGYIGYEDSGTRPLGIERSIYGFNWGNAFNRDDQLGYQFTASSDSNSLRAHSGSYTTWLSNRDSLSIYGTYAAIETDTIGGILQNGTAWQVSAKYDREIFPGAFCPRTCEEHHFVAGFDFKSTDTDLDFGGVNVFSSPADIAQLTVGYYGFWRNDINTASWGANLFVGLDGLTRFNNDASFNVVRSGSDTDYIYAYAWYERRWQLPKCLRLVTRFTGQMANERLQPSEQLGLSGFNAVRGYDLRDVTGDAGFVSNFELRTQPIGVGYQRFEDAELQFLAFLDYGTAHNINAVAPEDANIDISSAGTGLRYRVGQNVSLRADYGWQLESLPSSTRSSRFHIGMTLFR